MTTAAAPSPPRDAMYEKISVFGGAGHDRRSGGVGPRRRSRAGPFGTRRLGALESDGPRIGGQSLRLPALSGDRRNSMAN